jgi:hypothetical protein
MDDDFFDIGGTSAKAAEIFAQIHGFFRVQLPLSVLYNASTVRALAEQLTEALGQGESPGSGLVPQHDRLVLMNAEGGDPPLFMIPGSGGNAISLINITRAMGAGQLIYGLDARGLDGKCSPLYDQHEIAMDHAGIIEQKYPGPYFLLGICHGAITAFEVARILREKGKEVVFLGLVDPMTVSLPQIKHDGDGKVTLPAIFRFLLEHTSYWRKRYRKQFIRDRLGILTARDRQDPQRPVRRQLSKANGYAGRRYKPQPFMGPVTLFLTKDCPEGRKKDGRQQWLDLLQKPGNSIEYIEGTGPEYLYSADGAPGFATVLRKTIDTYL